MKFMDLPLVIRDRFADAMLRLEVEASFPALTNKGEELELLLQEIVVAAYGEGRDDGFIDGVEQGRSVGYTEGYEAASTQDPTRL